MQSKIYLYEKFWTEHQTPIFSSDELSASVFTYSTGVKALKIQNSLGSATLLPFMGQMIWRCDFNGYEMAMKSIFDEPICAKEQFGETYGCFLMHCGLTAMGNPTEEDTHTPHGELPICKYDSAYLIYGKDEKGEYIGLSGVYTHKLCFELDYEFSPTVKLYKGATYLDIQVDFTNHKEVPLEYYYLCHINHRPVDGARLCYTADRKTIKVNHEVPDNYYNAQHAKETNEYLDRLDKDPSIMDEIGGEKQSYKPEIVFSAKYSKDENGNAYTMQLNPNGTATFVVHKPDQLPVGTRWIARTGDEDAMGMVLPATSEHMGRVYCQRNNQQRYLKRGEKVTYNMQTGYLDEKGAKAMLEKIEKLGYK